MKSNYLSPLSRFLSVITFVIVSASIGFGQLNTFDGKSIELIAPDIGDRCVAGFGGNPTVKRLPGNTSSISVQDCNGNVLGTITDTSGLPIARDQTTGYWCFKTSDAKVNVAYTGETTNYSWTWIANTENSGFYNVRDFGALGNGYNANGSENSAANDTQAIRNALVYVGAKLGGTLYFPEGVYRVDSTLVLPSSIVLKGTSGLAPQGYYTGNIGRGNATIYLAGENRSLFRIGECVNGVKFENLQLKAKSVVNTNGVEAVGKYKADGSASSQRFDFRNVLFDAFERGLYFRAIDTDKLWQIDYVNIDHCTFSGNRTAGIVIDSFNSDWKISSSFFDLQVYDPEGNQIRGDGIIIDRATSVQMTNSFGGGVNYTDTGRGGTFIKALFVGGLTIISSSAERVTESISYGKDRNSQIIWGTYSNTLTLINSGFGDPVNLFGRVNFVSTGNSYAAKTVNAGAGVRVYSTGDRFCMDLNGNYDPTAPCGRDQAGAPLPLNQVGFQGPGTIVFQTGQPSELNSVSGQQIAAIPARLKGDLDIKGNDRELDSSAAANSRPILSVTVDNDGTLPLKPLVRLGHTPYLYDIVRDERGWLKFSGTQGQPYRGYFFSAAPLQIGSFTWSQINSLDFALSQPGTIVYCSDCQPNSTSCQTGGNGALAVLNGLTQWSCK